MEHSSFDIIKSPINYMLKISEILIGFLIKNSDKNTLKCKTILTFLKKQGVKTFS